MWEKIKWKFGLRHLVYHISKDDDSVYLDRNEGRYRCTAINGESDAFILKIDGKERRIESHEDLV